ncbi:MAG: hypothetical protein WB990_02590, partial [Candidatus Acidiferrales bacterium]
SAGVAAKIAANPEAAPAPSGGMNTGVKIHGHWKIVVRNPDGTVATRRDFENSLDLGGINLLPNLLAGGVTPGAWAIALGAQTAGNTGPCSGTTFQLYATSNVPASSSGNCFIGEPTGIYAATCASPLCSPNLSVTVLPFGYTVSPATGAVFTLRGGLQLTGSAMATSGGTIDTVASLLIVCQPMASRGVVYPLSLADPSSCISSATLGEPRSYDGNGVFPSASQFGLTFSSTILNGASATSTPPAPVQVVANQTIQVTVVFTFN